jgi:hypothetical protein
MCSCRVPELLRAFRRLSRDHHEWCLWVCLRMRSWMCVFLRIIAQDCKLFCSLSLHLLLSHHTLVFSTDLLPHRWTHAFSLPISLSLTSYSVFTRVVHKSSHPSYVHSGLREKRRSVGHRMYHGWTYRWPAIVSRRERNRPAICDPESQRTVDFWTGRTGHVCMHTSWTTLAHVCMCVYTDITCIDACTCEFLSDELSFLIHEGVCSVKGL